MLKARAEQLAQMVEARKQALARLLVGLRSTRRPLSPNVTVETALTCEGNALAHCDDVVTAGAELVQRTAGQARGMHHRIAKTLGIKVAPPK